MKKLVSTARLFTQAALILVMLATVNPAHAASPASDPGARSMLGTRNCHIKLGRP